MQISTATIFSPLDTLPRYGLKQKILKSTQPLIYWSGLAALFAQVRRSSSATILMYHSVPTPELSAWIDPYNSMPAATFERQMKFLARHRHVVSMDQLVASLRQGQKLPRGTVALTFDDGYLDNLKVAAPILARYDLPATLYLATDAIDHGKPQWIDALYTAFRTRSYQWLSLEDYGLKTWQLVNPIELRSAYFAIVQRLLDASLEKRNQLMAAITARLVPNQCPPRLTLNWSEVRQLRQQFPNVELGVHTVNHLDLSTHSDRAEWEISTALARIEAETGYRPKHLAYPYNRYNADAQTVARSLNLTSAVATSDEPVIRDHLDCYALPRLESSRSMTLLRLRTGGAFPDLSKRLFGRAWTAAY